MNNIRNLKLDAETRALVNALGNKFIKLCKQQKVSTTLSHFKLEIHGPKLIWLSAHTLNSYLVYPPDKDDAIRRSEDE